MTSDILKSLNNDNKKYVISVTAMLLFIGAFCCLSLFFNFPQSDDYWSFLKNNGVNCFQNVWHTYMTWMGNYTWVFLGSIIGYFNLFSFVRWYPLLLVVTSICSFWFFFSAFKGIINNSQVVLYTLLAQCSWFIVVPYLNENFYWFSASVGYYNTATIIVLQMGFIARLFGSNYSNKHFAFRGLLIATVLAGGMSALTVAAQGLVFLILATICYFYEDKVQAINLFCIALIAFICLTIVLICPGAHMRKAVDAVNGGNIAIALSVALHNSPVLLVLLFSTPLLYVSLLFFPRFSQSFKVMSCFRNLPVKPRLVYVVLLEILVAAGFQFIHGYALGYEMPPRARGLVVWIMFVAWLFFFCCYYRNNSLSRTISNLKIYKLRVPLLCLCFILNMNFIYLVHDYAIGPAYAKQSEAQYEYVRQEKAKGHLKLIVPAINVFPRLLRFHLGIRHPFNAMLFSRYWGIESIKEVPSCFITLERDGISPNDINLPMEEWASMGVPKYQYELAKSYDSRYATNLSKVNNKQALMWYLKAAENNYALAMNQLAGLYCRGLGCKRNYFEAAKWYFLSKYELHAPDAGAEYLNLAMGLDKREYLRGQIESYDEDAAFKLYMKAAEEGNKKAQRMLVGLYRRGLGCHKSYVTAIEYFIMSHLRHQLLDTTELYDDLANDDKQEVYPAQLYEGINFSRSGLPLFIKQVSGLADREAFGRWSDARKAQTVKIKFINKLPNSFMLNLKGMVQNINVGKHVKIIIGSKKYTAIIDKEDFNITIKVNLNGENIKTIEFIPPATISPVQLWSSNDDNRKLGIGFMSLKIITAHTYKDKLAKGFSFNTSTLPDVLSYTEGLSILTKGQDSCWRWSDAVLSPTVKLHFVRKLPKSFKLYLRARAFGPNIGKDLIIKIGSYKFSQRILSDDFIVDRLVENPDEVDTLEFVPPSPAYPKEIENNVNVDFSQRKLGIGFIKLRLTSE